VKWHGEVYDAMRLRDTKAAKKAMAAHMRQAGKLLLERFNRLARGDIASDSQTQSELPHTTVSS
jgi:DNA-binding GntR family transcriptional regulator